MLMPAWCLVYNVRYIVCTERFSYLPSVVFFFRQSKGNLFIGYVLSFNETVSSTARPLVVSSYPMMKAHLLCSRLRMWPSLLTERSSGLLLVWSSLLTVSSSGCLCLQQSYNFEPFSTFRRSCLFFLWAIIFYR